MYLVPLYSYVGQRPVCEASSIVKQAGTLKAAIIIIIHMQTWQKDSKQIEIITNNRKNANNVFWRSKPA